MRTDTSRKSAPRLLLTALAALTLLSGATALAQQVWKWVDKNGVTHYSDQPIPGAVPVDIKLQTYSSDEATVPTTPRPTATPSATPPAQQYELIEVWKPENDLAITGTGGQLSVSVRVLPRVFPGHSVRLELDGVRVSEPNSQATDFELTEIARGTHTLSASIVTRDGQTLIQGTPVTFHMILPVVRPPAR
jgi:hypothetical protein